MKYEQYGVVCKVNSIKQTYFDQIVEKINSKGLCLVRLMTSRYRRRRMVAVFVWRKGNNFEDWR